MNLWIHDKYSSTHFKQLLWQRKALWQCIAQCGTLDRTSRAGGCGNIRVWIQIRVNIPFPILVNKVTQSEAHLEPKEFSDASLLNVWPVEGLTDGKTNKLHYCINSFTIFLVLFWKNVLTKCADEIIIDHACLLWIILFSVYEKFCFIL